MVAPLIWSDSWLLGIEMLDDGHREMVRLINRLADPVEPTAIMTRLDDLIALLREHFQVEERFLEAIRYPGREKHRREHSIQLAEFVDLRRRMSVHDVDQVDASSLREIKDCFFNHVVGDDRNFAIFYHDTVCADGVGYRPRRGS